MFLQMVTEVRKDSVLVSLCHSKLISSEHTPLYLQKMMESLNGFLQNEQELMQSKLTEMFHSSRLYKQYHQDLVRHAPHLALVLHSHPSSFSLVTEFVSFIAPAS